MNKLSAFLVLSAAIVNFSMPLAFAEDKKVIIGGEEETVKVRAAATAETAVAAPAEKKPEAARPESSGGVMKIGAEGTKESNVSKAATPAAPPKPETNETRTEAQKAPEPARAPQPQAAGEKKPDEKPAGATAETKKSDPAPAAPSAVVAKHEAGAVDISWNETPGAYAYLVYRNTKDELPKDYSFQTSEPKHRDAEIEDERSYYYFVVAVSRDPQNPKQKYFSKPSQVIRVDTADRTPPATPSGLAVKKTGKGFELSWKKSSEPDFAAYTVKKGSAKDAAAEVAKIEKADECSYSDADCRDGEAYHYFVTAIDKKGNASQPAEAVSEKFEDRTPPREPANLRVDSAKDGEATISWDAPEGASELKYVIFRGTAGKDLEERTVIEKRSFTDTGLRNGEKYGYAVMAMNRYGVRGKLSATASAEPRDTVAPTAPQNLVGAPAASKMELSWERPGGEEPAFYTIYRAGAGQAAARLAGAEKVAATRYTDSTVTPGTEYSYSISATDAVGNESERSKPLAVKTRERTSMNFCYAGRSFSAIYIDPATKSLMMAESPDGKSAKAWATLQESMPLPDGLGRGARIAFARDGKKISAFIYDTEDTSIKTAVSADGGKTWKWWADYSSSLPLPDDFDEDTVLSFSVRGETVTCLCLNPAKKWLAVASTTGGKSWKWWKKAATQISDAPNASDSTILSAAASGEDIELFSYAPGKRTLYRGAVDRSSRAVGSWVQFAPGLSAPAGLEK